MTIDSKGTEKEVQTDTDQNLMKDKNLHTRIQKEIRDNEKKTESAGISRKQEHANLEKIADSHTVNDYMFNTSLLDDLLLISIDVFLYIQYIHVLTIYYLLLSHLLHCLT